MKRNKRILKRKEKGITLIALVITIIVLLILAGVSIAMLTGENGILTQAQRAKEATENAARNEAKDLQELESWMNGQITGEEQAYPVNDDNPGKLDGEGTSEKPYKIESIEDLVAFSSIVNTGECNGETYNNNEYTGEYVELSQTLDFNYDGSYALESSLESGGLKDTLTNGGFEIIGKDANGTLSNNIFAGTFDGKGNTIKNISLKNDVIDNGVINATALFAFVQQGGKVQNLNVTGNIEITTSITNIMQGFGGIVGINLGTVENCNTDISIYGDKIASERKGIGGIAGINLGTINGCYSNVNIENSPTTIEYMGGIVGANTNTMYNCIAEGSIIVHGETSVPIVGGIIGSNMGIGVNLVSDVTIEVDNQGGDIRAGGIVGNYTNETSDSVAPENRLIANCYFKGTIRNKQNTTNSLTKIGGIVGYLGGVTVSSCYSNCTLENTGTVKQNLYIGMGYANGATIRNCKYINGENIINESGCNLVNNTPEDLTDEKVVNYMNTYADQDTTNLKRWTISGGKIRFE